MLRDVVDWVDEVSALLRKICERSESGAPNHHATRSERKSAPFYEINRTCISKQGVLPKSNSFPATPSALKRMEEKPTPETLTFKTYPHGSLLPMRPELKEYS